MRGHNLCFYGAIRKTIPKYPCDPSLSEPLIFVQGIPKFLIKIHNYFVGTAVKALNINNIELQTGRVTGIIKG